MDNINKFKKSFLEYAKAIDSLTYDSYKLREYSLQIIENEDRDATISFLNSISQINKNYKENKELMKLVCDIYDSLLFYLGYEKISDICNNHSNDELSECTLEELLEKLNSLVGLEGVKEKVNDLIAYQKVQRLRRENGLHTSKSTLHLAFTGNPGTGKTTVARIVGRIYKQIGLLSRGHFIEVSRTDLIAGYQGQTALKVKKVIERAKGGVLFIDEAYSITENEHTDSYGRECLTELTKALEDYRDDLVVIVAGYTEPMNKFFESNPGLKSRFNTFIEFDDYSSDELEQILVMMCEQNDYKLDEQASKIIKKYLDEIIISKDENFANGRLARNIYDDLVMNHAKRVSQLSNPDYSTLNLIIPDDFKICK